MSEAALPDEGPAAGAGDTNDARLLLMRANEVVLAALEVRAGPARQAVVDAGCGDDAVLHAKVDALLAQVSQLDGFLDAPGGAVAQASAAFDAIPVAGGRIGVWRVVSELGRGGMGVVLLVEREDGVVRQRGALKLIKRGMDTDAIVRRFRNERQILASLEHPNIAHLIDGGATEDGRPYLVMEYVEGVPIDRWCADRSLDLEARLQLFMDVCSAVHYAHQRLVVHRDLKPGNILVGGDSIPKLLDFGIAKLLDPTLAAQTLDATAEYQRLLTPHYASPEQLLGAPVTTASDIYALGVVLYELLTGCSPYPGETLSSAQIAEAVLNDTAVRPSTAALNAPGADPAQARRRASQLRGDLDNIVRRAMAREPGMRYSSADELRDDLRRHLDGEAVRAVPPSWRYRTGKFVARHRLAVAASTLAAVALVVGASLALWQAHEADRERLTAEQRFEDVRKLARTMLFDINDELEKGPTAAREKLVTTAVEYLNRLAADRALEPALKRDVAAGFERIGDIVGNPVYANLGRTGDAETNYQRALTLREALFKTEPTQIDNLRGLLSVHERLGDVAWAQGRVAETAERYHAATDAAERVASQTHLPADALYLMQRQRFDAAIRYTRGQPSLGQLNDARARFEALVGALDRFAAAHADGPRVSKVLVPVLTQLADLQRVSGNFDAALHSAMRARDLCSAEVQAQPDDPRWSRTLAIAERQVGEVLIDLGRGDDGVAALQRSLAIRRAVADRDAGDARAQRDLASGRFSLGDALALQNRHAEALIEYQAALATFKAQAQANPKLAMLQSGVQQAERAVAQEYLALDQPERARAVLEPRLGAPGSDAKAVPASTPAAAPSAEALAPGRLVYARTLARLGERDQARQLAQDSATVLQRVAAVDVNDTFTAYDAADASLQAGLVAWPMGMALSDGAQREQACRLTTRAQEVLAQLREQKRLTAHGQQTAAEAERASARCA